jgi:hydroxylamine dehydrogenase
LAADHEGLPGGQWLPGRDYSAGPTCASCHVSATPNHAVTHDVGARISWTLRPAISTKLADWEKKRSAMQDVCRQCHSTAFAAGFYNQFDDVVNIQRRIWKAFQGYYGRPDGEETADDAALRHPDQMALLRERHGASMAGPDYTWWHGLYEVAKVFYTDSVPQARALDAKVVDDALGGMTEHNWLTNGLSEKQIRQILDFYKERYAQWPEAAVGDCQSVLRGAPCGVPIRSRVRGRPDRQHGHYRACLSPTSAARD